MSADSSAAQTRPAPNLGEALYFDSGPHSLFGWLHRAAGGKGSGLGLVLCNPFGYEAVCAHRGVRTLAEVAAARGVDALRFDYSGTGDSADIESQSSRSALTERYLLRATGLPSRIQFWRMGAGSRSHRDEPKMIEVSMTRASVSRLPAAHKQIL